MITREFRGDEFINREKEIEFFKNYFNHLPQRILWVYGPKSTGKTTLIEYVIENALIKGIKAFKKPQYWIKYINFRRTLVTDYDNFLYSFLKEVENNDDFSDSGELDVELNLGVIRINSRLFKQIKEKKTNLFDELIKKLRKIKEKKIIIIDEIQLLEDIYLNGNKLLLNEFLNFCVALTKETHIAHVVILTSNTIFLEQIYSNSRLKETSNFRLIDHLDFDDIRDWLRQKKFTDSEIDLIYDFLGGSATRIKKLLEEYKYYPSLREYLEHEAIRAKNEIEIYIAQEKLNDNLIEKFEFIASEIVKKGYFYSKKLKDYIDVVSLFSKVEILFFDPINNKTTASNRLYVKAFQIEGY